MARVGLVGEVAIGAGDLPGAVAGGGATTESRRVVGEGLAVHARGSEAGLAEGLGVAGADLPLDRDGVEDEAVVGLVRREQADGRVGARIECVATFDLQFRVGRDQILEGQAGLQSESIARVVS